MLNTTSGSCTTTAEGVPQDYQEAMSWYRKAAEQGNASAQYNLGVSYANGQGVPQDYVQAHKWINLAASRTKENAEDFRLARDSLAEKMTALQVGRSQAVGAGMATYELGATEGQESGSPFNTLARIPNLIQTFRPSSGLQHQNKQEPQRTKPTTKGDGCAPSCGVAGPAKLGMLVSLMLKGSGLTGHY